MKNFLWIPFMLITCIVVIVVTPRSVSAQGTTVSVQPEHIIGPPPDIDETFEINITVSNVANLYTWQAGMTFNSSVLEAISFEEGPFLKTWAESRNQTSIWVEGTIDNVAGIITYYGCVLTGNISGASGNGTLGTVTFKAKNHGSSPIHLTDEDGDPAETMLLDPDFKEITSVTLQDGYFELPKIPHNVAVINVVPSTTAVYAGQSLNITVVAKNRGTSIETFNVTAYNDTTPIGTQTLIDLNPGEIRNLTFVWDTTTIAPCTNHTISAEASEVPGEVHVADNTFVDGITRVKKMGDVDGDSDIDSMDLFTLAVAYGTKLGDPLYNAACDFDGDNDVDSMDLFTLAANYGKTCT